MAMSCTITEKTVGSAKKVTFAWVSAADGTATGTTTYKQYDGEVLGLTTIPGAAALAPDDNYDITVMDADSHDVLLGAGANRDTANTEHVTRASLAVAAHTSLTINVSGAGDSNAGTAIVYLR
jgi:hypothetical protein